MDNRIWPWWTLAVAAATVACTVHACCGGLTGEASSPTLTVVPGSTAKVSQLIGDHDKHLGRDTLSRTEERFGVIGTGLGLSFDHCDGRIVFVFGDTEGVHQAETVVRKKTRKGKVREVRSEVGSYRGGDSIGFSRSTSPDALELEFFTDADGNYVVFAPEGRRLAGFQIPSGGICVGDQLLVAYNQRQDADAYPGAYSKAELGRYEQKIIDRHLYKKSSLARFDDRTGEVTTLRELSNVPEGGRFATVAMHHQTDPVPGLPAGDPHVLVWGTGIYRKSACYLQACPASSFEGGEGTRYFAGLDKSGEPQWSTREDEAAPVVDGELGNVSVTWVAELGLWVMLYDIREPQRAIVLRHATQPYGPWSEPQFVIDAAVDDGWREFTHTRKGDGLAGPVIGEAKEDPESRTGGLFAPYVVERFTAVEGDRLDLYWTLSTWNPYVVVLMKSSFEVGR